MHMMIKQGPCFFCGCQSSIESNIHPFGTFYQCPTCGRYMISFTQGISAFPISKDKVASYLFYKNSVYTKEPDRRDHICLIGSKTQTNLYTINGSKYDTVTYEEIEAFYPETLASRIETIMELLHRLTPNFGRSIKLSPASVVSCFFINRYDDAGNNLSNESKNAQFLRICNYLVEKKYIVHKYKDGWNYFSVLADGAMFVEQHNYEIGNDFSISYDIRIKSKFLIEKIKELIAEDNTSDAIGKAKELIESCCRTILNEHKKTWNKDWALHELAGETMETLGIRAKDVQGTEDIDKSTKALLSNLIQISQRVAEIRNIAGSGHGRPENFTPVEQRYAQLAVGASITFVRYLWDVHLNSK